MNHRRSPSNVHNRGVRLDTKPGAKWGYDENQAKQAQPVVGDADNGAAGVTHSWPRRFSLVVVELPLRSHSAASLMFSLTPRRNFWEYPTVVCVNRYVYKKTRLRYLQASTSRVSVQKYE